MFGGEFADSPQKILMLDYDGTLAPFTTERDRAIPYEGVREVLDSIQTDTETRLIIVSGRKIDDLLPLLALPREPEIWGCHGFEHLPPGGKITRKPLPADCRTGLENAFGWLSENGYVGYCERKAASIAFHVRGLAIGKARSLLREVRSSWEPLAGKGGLEIHNFDGGIELRYAKVNKGDVVRQVMAESGKGRFIAYLGDDRTDEDAFRVLKDRGMSVLVRDKCTETEADFWLRPPGQLIEFLQAWRDRCK
jgi:trehalose-phosphatase